MRVLIDNSTYYSSKSAIQEGLLTAHTVYNLAAFLECIVVADKVCFAPTTLWYPGVTDGYLFGTDGPCEKLLNVADSDKDARSVFLRSIDESIRDLDSTVVREQFEAPVIQEARNILSVSRLKAEEGPSGFMETYSGIVYLTDEGTSTYFEETYGKERKCMAPGQHLTNYLLRCNVAMEMSGRLVYHPHSQRVPLVCAKMGLSSRQSPALASALIRDMETEIEQKLTDSARETLLLPFRLFACVDSDLPLVLAVALSGANKPDQVVPQALELRNLPQAHDYRNWISSLVTAIREGDVAARTEVSRQLLEAREALSRELRRLYGPRREGGVSRFSQLASVVDPEDIVGANMRSAVIKLGKDVLQRVPDARSWWREHRVRRRIALLISLAEKRQRLNDLNSLLARTFHTQLSSDQLHQLDTLRKNQARIMAELVRGAQR